MIGYSQRGALSEGPIIHKVCTQPLTAIYVEGMKDTSKDAAFTTSLIHDDPAPDPARRPYGRYIAGRLLNLIMDAESPPSPSELLSLATSGVGGNTFDRDATLRWLIQQGYVRLEMHVVRDTTMQIRKIAQFLQAAEKAEFPGGRSRAWTDERRRRQSEQMTAYWARRREARAAPMPPTPTPAAAAAACTCAPAPDGTGIETCDACLALAAELLPSTPDMV